MKRAPTRIGTRMSDKRVFDFFFQIETLRAMPLIDVKVGREGSFETMIADKLDRNSWDNFSIEQIISIDLNWVQKNGGTFRAIKDSLSHKNKTHIDQHEVERATDNFLAGNDGE